MNQWIKRHPRLERYGALLVSTLLVIVGAIGFHRLGHDVDFGDPYIAMLSATAVFVSLIIMAWETKQWTVIAVGIGWHFTAWVLFMAWIAIPRLTRLDWELEGWYLAVVRSCLVFGALIMLVGAVTGCWQRRCLRDKSVVAGD